MTDVEKHLILLGGAGGIGRAVARRAIRDGWRVSVLDLAASLARHDLGDEVATVEIDLTAPETITPAFEAVGPARGYVNLSGFMTGVTALEDTSLAEFDEVMQGNFRGAYLAAKAVLPFLRMSGGGSMVHVVSGLASFVRPGYGLYGASKAAMIHLTKTLALEAAPDVRVNAVGPAAIDTAFLHGGTGRSDEDQPSSLDIDAYVRMTPLSRMGLAADVVGPVMFLLGEDSGFMTGQTIWVNGGGYMP